MEFLFNHESPRRGETFVTRKITLGLIKIKLKLQNKLVLGNLEAKKRLGTRKILLKLNGKFYNNQNQMILL